MIDLHCHIVWGVDDGPSSPQQSLGMLELAVSSGTTDIVATPHSNREFAFLPDLVQERIAYLLEGCGNRVRIHRGCDLNLNYENVQDVLVQRDRYTINGGRFLLVEIPDLSSPASVTPILHRLAAEGLTPIITHPERHATVRKDFQRLRAWISDGCLVQVTAASLTGRFGAEAKKHGWKMVESGFAHFVASDAHDTRDRTPDLARAFEAIGKRCGFDRARDLLIENPACVLRNELLSHVKVLPPLPTRKWFHFRAPW